MLFQEFSLTESEINLQKNIPIIHHVKRVTNIKKAFILLIFLNEPQIL